MPDQVKLSPSSMQDALGCPRCLVVAHRHGIESENFMPWVGNFAAWEEKHFVGKNIADEVPGAPSWTVTSKGSKTIRVLVFSDCWARHTFQPHAAYEKGALPSAPSYRPGQSTSMRQISVLIPVDTLEVLKHE